MYYEQLRKCTSCDPPCGIWLGGSAKEYQRGAMRKIAPDDATEGYVVLAQALPTAETPFLEVRDGSIEIYAEDPCPIWRVRISKMHKDGFKYIYFSKTLPDGAKKFNVRDFETPPAAEQSMEFVI